MPLSAAQRIVKAPRNSSFRPSPPRFLTPAPMLATCRPCSGAGMLVEQRTSAAYGAHKVAIRCPHCAGKGLVASAVTAPDSKMIAAGGDR